MSLPNNNPFNKIKCLDTTSMKSLIFNNSNMEIIKGAQTLLSVVLKDLFIPVEDYLYQEFKLAANGSIQIDPANIVNASGEISFVALVVEYPKYDVSNVEVPTIEKYLNFTYPLSGQTMNIGKIMVLSGTNKAGAGWDLISSPGGLLLSNPHTNFDVTVKVVIIK